MRQRWLGAIVCSVGIATITACGSTRNIAQTHTATRPTTPTQTVARPVAARSYPVYQLPPGHITLAEARTPQGPVAIALHRIRYFGHVSLCVSESNANGGTDQSCANYPLGPKSNQNIGDAPVWWAASYLSVCTTRHFLVVDGVVLRPGLTAWLRTPRGTARMPTAAIPKGFGVAGGLVYATITAAPDTVMLRDADGRAVYSASMGPLSGLPTLGCGNGRAVAGGFTVHTSGGIVQSSSGRQVVP
jgi:hypothetical protein